MLTRTPAHFFALAIASLFLFVACEKTGLDQTFYGPLVIEDATPLPELADETIIAGNVSIDFASGERPDLTPLERIVEINGTLTIGPDVTEADLQYLRNLESVGTLTVGQNESLENLDVFSQLQIVRNFYLFQTKVKSVPAFSGTNKLLGDLSLNGNSEITEFTGFTNLMEIGDDLTFILNEKLTRFELPFVSGLETVVVHSNAALTDIDLDNLTRIGGDLNVSGNNALTALSGFAALDTIENRLAIDGNPELTALSGLSALTYVWRVEINNNENLSDLCALKTALEENPPVSYSVGGNAWNPTQNELIAGCE